MESLAAASIRKIRDFGPSDFTKTASAFATLNVRVRPLLKAIASEAIRKIRDIDALDLCGLAWAFAVLGVVDAPLLEAIASAAINKSSELSAKNLLKLAWSYAALSVRVAPLMEAISASARKMLRDFTSQELVNIAWAFATLQFCDMPLMEAISSASIARLSAGAATSDLKPQDFSKLAWAFATISVRDRPLMEAIAAAAIPRISAMVPQAIANIAWAFARLDVRNLPLFEAIASAALAKLSDFPSRDRSKLAWAFEAMDIQRPLISGTVAPLLDGDGDPRLALGGRTEETDVGVVAPTVRGRAEVRPSGDMPLTQKRQRRSKHSWSPPSGRGQNDPDSDDRLLGVSLLMSWELGSRCSADDLESHLGTFLSRESPPRRDSEIFLRGLLRNLSDIDRLLRTLNPTADLERVSKDKVALSVLRTLTYELMWSQRDARWFEETTDDLIERCGEYWAALPSEADTDWIACAMVRMKAAVLKVQSDWDFKHAQWAHERGQVLPGTSIRLVEGTSAKARPRPPPGVCSALPSDFWHQRVVGAVTQPGKRPRMDGRTRNSNDGASLGRRA